MVPTWSGGTPGRFWFVASIPLLLYVFLLDVRLTKGEEMLDVVPMVELKRLRIDLLKNYDRMKNPIAENSMGTALKIYFDTQYIVSMDEKYQILTVKGILLMRWSDSRLSWNPDSYTGTLRIHFSSKEIWVPNVHSLYNVKHVDISDSPTPITVYNNGSVKWCVPAMFDVPCSAQYRHYPFDSHNCSIALAPWSLHKINMTFEKPESWQASIVQGTEWIVTRIDQEYVEGNFRLGASHVRVNIFMERASRIYRYICVVPTLVSMISLLFGFWLLPDETSRYLVGCCNIIVLSMLLQHLAVTVPAGKVVPLLAQYCASCLCMSAVFIIITVVVNLLRECSGMPPSGLVRVAHFSLDRYLCIFAFSHVSSGKKMADENISPDEVKRRKDWYTVSIMFDRIAFWCFIFIFGVLLAVLAAI